MSAILSLVTYFAQSVFVIYSEFNKYILISDIEIQHNIFHAL